MGHKRKRQEESGAADEPAPKKQVTEKSASTSAAERRQKRSERQSKKSLEAKKNASRNGKKNKAKYEPKSKTRTKSISQASTSPELVKASLATTDNLAQGQDFISLTESTNPATAPTPALQPTVKKAKKSSPRSERKKAKAEKAKTTAIEDVSADATTAATADESATATTTPKPSADPRFIVFVGNLPYTTTTEQITSHFRKLTPTSIRHPSDKSTGKSKGYAFLEFDNYSSMKTCLKMYHHSLFDPERTSKLPEDAFDENGLEIVRPGQENKRGTGRRINVELTAGGGGKSEDRKEKIRVKNTRLEEQRDRRREADMKAEKAKSKKSRGVSDANATEVQEKADDGRGAIHPSRLKRVQA